MKVPPPLTSGHLCPDCHGTGANIKATEAAPASDSGYIRCWTCNGGGLDPAEYFRWSSHSSDPAGLAPHSHEGHTTL